MNNDALSMEEIKTKIEHPLTGLTGVRFIAENFTTLTFRRGDIASIELSKLSPSYPELFDFASAPEFSRYFKTDYVRIKLLPCADNMNRFDEQPDTMVAVKKDSSVKEPTRWRYLNVFERLLKSPNIISWHLLYYRYFWNTDTARCIIVSLPYINKYEGTGSWHEHNILQTSYLDEAGCLNIEINTGRRDVNGYVYES